MTDRENVIRGLNRSNAKIDMMHTVCLRCGKPAVSIPFNCDELGMKVSYTHYSYCEKCLREGLKLLKEQEAVQPTIDEYGNKRCGSCGHKLQSIADPDLFCCKCGKPVLWKGR